MESVRFVLNTEAVRYRRKLEGGYFFLGCALWYMWFWVLPRVVQQFVWPRLENAIETGAVSAKFVDTWGTLIIHFGIFYGVNFLYAFVYLAGLFQKFKSNPYPWPWASSPKHIVPWTRLRLQSLKYLFINHFVVAPTLAVIFAEEHDMRSSTIPSGLMLCAQFIFCMAVEDTAFYWAHRLLHESKFLYRHVHKIHHQFNVSASWASEYSHFVEYIINIVAMYVPVFLWPAHSYTLFAWVAWHTLEPIDAHCGFDFPWSPWRLLPMQSTSSTHDFHHSSNCGNYGSYFTWWDRIMGTDAKFYEAYYPECFKKPATLKE